MIIGVFLRYFKVYKGWSYIPLSTCDNFSGLVGDNGVGKSSILEALDCYFNTKEWNYNLQARKSGLDTVKPAIVPVFLLDESFFGEDLKEDARLLSNYIRDYIEGVKKVTPANAKTYKDFNDHIQELIRLSTDKYHSKILLPLGLTHDRCGTISIFDNELSSHLSIDRVDTLINKVISDIDYLYIPRELDTETFTKLENQEVQVLMGESINQILSNIITPQIIKDTNKSLNDFIDQIANELESYTYRMPRRARQELIKGNQFYDVIIRTFFAQKTLHRKEGESNWLEINVLSSGEKQKAVIDIARGFLKNHRETGTNLILAIDEPEASLHMNACFEQFSALYEISQSCMQTIFSTHWYGFLPIIENGTAVIIKKKSDEHSVDLLPMANHREHIRQLRDNSTRGNVLPHNIRLKSLNDFIQSVISSTCMSIPYNWIICEGSTEKVYLSTYLESEIKDKNLRIVPVGGASEVKKIYNYLAAIYDDFKAEMKGRIVLLSDTDAVRVDYPVTDLPHIKCKRLIMDRQSKSIRLVDPNSSLSAPITAIEDCLESSLYVPALKDIATEMKRQDIIELLSTVESSTEFLSGFALDLRPTELEKISTFLKELGVKYKIAKTYIKIAEILGLTTPEWIINEIKLWLFPSELV